MKNTEFNKHSLSSCTISPQNTKTPFDDLSYMALLFLLQQTDFSEPWAGFGFASEMAKQVISAIKRKSDYQSPSVSGLVQSIIEEKGLQHVS